MSKYIATIGVDYGVKPVKVDGADVRVNFWDLSGTPFSILWFMLHYISLCTVCKQVWPNSLRFGMSSIKTLRADFSSTM